MLKSVFEGLRLKTAEISEILLLGHGGKYFYSREVVPTYLYLEAADRTFTEFHIQRLPVFCMFSLEILCKGIPKVLKKKNCDPYADKYSLL